MDDARSDLVEAVELCRREGEREELAQALTGLGQIERDLQHLAVARGLYQEAVTIYRSVDNPLKLAHAVRHVGDILRHEGQTHLADSSYQEALTIYRGNAQTLPLDLANTIRGLAILKADTGQLEQSKLLWEEAGGLYAAVHVEAGVAECSRRVAELAQKTRRTS